MISSRLSGQVLTHLYVLMPVRDNDKHYWVGDDEVEKLLRHGEGWLVSHPEREVITTRYLKYRRSLIQDALGRLVGEEDPDPDGAQEAHAQEEAAVEERIRLNEQRLGAVVAALKSSGAKRVIDLGCGEGMVVKPMDFIVRGRRGLVQPAIKCRGREYLRIIYGPEYTAPKNLERLRSRGLSSKRSLAIREFALGIETLERFVRREPLRRILQRRSADSPTRYDWVRTSQSAVQPSDALPDVRVARLRCRGTDR
jgi:hypothetical protein